MLGALEDSSDEDPGVNVTSQDIAPRAVPDVDIKVRRSSTQETATAGPSSTEAQHGALPERGLFQVVEEWSDSSNEDDDIDTHPTPLAAAPSVDKVTSSEPTDPAVLGDMVNRMLPLVARCLSAGAEDLDPSDNLWGAGLSSRDAVVITEEISVEFGVAVDVADVMANFSVIRLSELVATKLATKDAAGPHASDPDEVCGKFEECDREMTGLPRWFVGVWGVWVTVLIAVISGLACAPIFAFEEWVWSTSKNHLEVISTQPLKYEWHQTLGTWKLLLMFPLYVLMFCLGVSVATLVLKWMLIGRFKQGECMNICSNLTS